MSTPNKVNQMKKEIFDPHLHHGFFQIDNAPEFNYNAKQFDLTNAWWMAELSRLCYSTNKNLVRYILTCHGFHDVYFINDKDIELFITYNEKGVFIIFRGTELVLISLRDILISLISFPKGIDEVGRAHYGYYKSVQAVSQKIVDILSEILEDRSLWIGGHSLGGALATVCGVKFIANGIYTFGSPKVGNKDFVENIKSPHYRLYNRQDMIPHYPFFSPFYSHLDKNSFYVNDEEVEKEPSFGFFKKLKKSKGDKILEYFMSFLMDHSIFRYSNNLLNAVRYTNSN